MDSLIPFTTSGALMDCVDTPSSLFTLVLSILYPDVRTAPTPKNAFRRHDLGKMLVILRDGRKLHGVLRSYDQFANLVLEDTVERIHHGDTYAENWHGLFLIRGENVVLLGEIDLDKEDEVPLRQVDYRLLEPYVKQDIEQKKQRDEAKAKVLYDKKGFCKEGGEGDGY